MSIIAGIFNEFMQKDMINWAELSLILTGRRDKIRKNYIPKKYKQQIDELLLLLDYWEHRNTTKGSQ